MMEFNLVLDYMAMEDLSLKEARSELTKIGAGCTSPLELLEQIGFEPDYIMGALEFIIVPKMEYK